MKRLFVCSLVSSCLWQAQSAAAPLNSAPLNFATDVQPILERSCLPCHNATKSEGGLILESPQAMLEGGDNGPVIRPKHALESLLYETAARKKKPFMPPEANKAKAPKLTAEQLEVFRRWIDEGALGKPKPRQAVAWKGMPPRVAGVSALAASPDGQFAAAGRGSHVTLYSLALQREVFRFEAHPDLVTALVFSPDGSLLATGSRGEVKLWKKALSPLSTLPESATTKAVSPDGTLEAEALAEQAPVIRKTAKKEDILKLSGDWTLQASLANADLALAGAKFEVEFLEKQTNTTRDLVTKTKTELEKADKEHKTLLPKRAEMEKAETDALAKREAQLRLRETAEDAVMAETRALDALKLRTDETTAALTKAEERLKAASAEEKTALLPMVEEARAASKKVADDKTASEAKLKTAKESAEARKKDFEDSLKALGLAAGAVSSAKTAEINAVNLAEVAVRAQKDLDTQTASLQAAKEALSKAEAQKTEAAQAAGAFALPAVDRLAFEPDGTVLFTRHTDGKIRAWNATTGAPLQSSDTHPRWELVRTLGDSSKADSPLTNRVNALAFSPDGKLLATGSGDPSRSGEIKIWNPQTGALVRELSKPHKDAVLSLDFSRDGRLLASGSADRAVRIWETSTGKLFRNLEAHGSHVLSVTFRNDARRLASASADNTVKTWDIQNSDVLATTPSFGKEVNFIRYLGRGEELMATSGSPVLRILRDGGGDVRAKTEGISRFLTAAAVTVDGQTQLVGDVDGTLLMLNREGKTLVKWSATPKDASN